MIIHFFRKNICSIAGFTSLLAYFKAPVYFDHFICIINCEGKTRGTVMLYIPEQREYLSSIVKAWYWVPPCSEMPKKVLVLPSVVHQTRWVDICWNKLLLQIRQSQCNVSSTQSKSVAMNADWSALPFLICKFIQEVLGIDINLSAQLKISVQVFCPTSLQNPYEIRYIPWMMIKPQKGV